MNLEWSREALADLNRFATFLSSKRPALAERVAQEFSRGPKYWRTIRNSAVRSPVVRSTARSFCRY
jgi:hypothetical protein